jgi:hypothetical protein
MGIQHGEPAADHKPRQIIQPDSICVFRVHHLASALELSFLTPPADGCGRVDVPVLYRVRNVLPTLNQARNKRSGPLRGGAGTSRRNVTLAWAASMGQAGTCQSGPSESSRPCRRDVLEHFGLTGIAGSTCHCFRGLPERRAVDIVQPDTCAAGGLSECKKIADMAAVRGVRFSPQVWGTGVAIAAALQLLAVM